MTQLSISGGVDHNLWWHRLKRFPGGKWLFSKILGWVVPYTGSISPYIQYMDSDCAVVYMKNNRKVKNHMGTTHAIAMTNLIELTASLALLTKPEKFDCVVTGVDSKFLKAGKGKWLWAKCSTLNVDLRKSTTAEVEVFDGSKRIATGTCTWRIWKHDD